MTSTTENALRGRIRALEHERLDTYYETQMVFDTFVLDLCPVKTPAKACPACFGAGLSCCLTCRGTGNIQIEPYA